MEPKKSVVVTGVSTGIGHALTKALLAQGFRVFGSVRSEQGAEHLRAEFGDSFCPLIFDVREPGQIARAVERVTAALAGRGLTALVNNSGISAPGPLAHQPLDVFREHLEVNVVGLLAVTQAFLPLLGASRPCAHPPGRIVNIGSVSGKIAYPFMGAYAASKHAVEGLSDVLRRELHWYGIDVVVIEPSTVKTPIVDKFAAELPRYAETDYGALLGKLEKTVQARSASALPVERVTEAVLHALSSARPKTRYPLPRSWLASWALPRLLPDRLFDHLVTKRLGLRQSS